MFAAKNSFSRSRRRTAMWLIAAWLVFGVSQAFAACCTPAGDAIRGSTQAIAAPQHQDEAAQDDCCDSAEQPCPVVLDEALPVPPTAVLFVPGEIRHLGGPPVPLVLHLPAAARADAPERVPFSQAPPYPIYLRLQRFLI
jgi:hypothetical protein